MIACGRFGDWGVKTDFILIIVCDLNILPRSPCKEQGAKGGNVEDLQYQLETYAISNFYRVNFGV